LETIYRVMSRSNGDTSAPTRPSTSGGPAPSAVAASPLRILVAEDSEFNVQLMKQVLGKRGHSVRVASNGREALSLANATDFDLLLLDLHMPELDGIQVIHSIRERERGTGTHLPVIALTARSRQEDRELCLAAGMDGFLAKPIRTDDLWAAINRVLAAPTPAQPGAVRLIDPRVLLAACGGDAAILKSICDTLRAGLPEASLEFRSIGPADICALNSPPIRWRAVFAWNLEQAGSSSNVRCCRSCPDSTALTLSLRRTARRSTCVNAAPLCAWSRER